MSDAVQAMFLFKGFLYDNPAFLGPEKDYHRVSIAYTKVGKWTGILGSAGDFCWQLEVYSGGYFECEVSEKFGHWLRDNLDAPIDTGVQEIVRLVRNFFGNQHPLTDRAVATMCGGMFAAAAKEV